ncbi:hypothetical protein MRX96_035782 [Rhipicephalus microplus]
MLLLARYLLIFVIGHCFTGGYISFLNKPTLEEVPDTKERLVSFLRNGRLDPCIVKNDFEHILMTRSDYPQLRPLTNSVRNWTKFAENSKEACVERTIQRHAVYFSAEGVLEPFAASLQGQAEISRVHARDIMFSSSVLLPKASPYKRLMNRVTRRVVETGVMEQMEDRYWSRTLQTLRSVPAEEVWQPLQLNESLLSFIVLAAGLCISCMAFLSESMFRISGKRQKLSAKSCKVAKNHGPD